MLFILIYCVFALFVTVVAFLTLLLRRERLSKTHVAFCIIIPMTLWAAPFLVDKLYALEVVGNNEDLPEDKSFLDGTWFGHSSTISKRMVISISNGRFEATNLPHTSEFRDGGSIKLQSISGSIEFEDWASGVALFLNGFDPVYIGRQNGEWRLLQNLSAVHGSKVVFRKLESQEPN